MRRENQLSPKDFDTINQLYWDKGYDQREIAEIFGCTQSHISRIVNGKACSYHCILTTKMQRLERNIKPLPNEPAQAAALRAKREILHSSKLTWEKVSRMRYLYFIGSRTEMQLAKMFGITQGTVSKIIQGTRWKSL